MGLGRSNLVRGNIAIGRLHGDNAGQSVTVLTDYTKGDDTAVVVNKTNRRPPLPSQAMGKATEGELYKPVWL